MVCLAVVLSGLFIRATSWYLVDPVLSLLIAVVIAWAGWGFLRESFRLSLEGAPSGIDAEAMLHRLLSLPGVSQAHDVHIWAASMTEHVMSAHLLMPAGGNDAFSHQTAAILRQEFNIHHCTLQIEQGDAAQVCHTMQPCGGACWPGGR